MILHLRSEDHPEANGRQARFGDERWHVRIPLEAGEHLHLELGREARDKLFGMLIADCADNGEPEPA